MLMNKQNLSESLFGLILTLIMFFILDYVAPNVNWIIRVGIILVLLFLGRLIFKWLFVNVRNNWIYNKIKFWFLSLMSLSKYQLWQTAEDTVVVEIAMTQRTCIKLNTYKWYFDIAYNKDYKIIYWNFRE